MKESTETLATLLNCRVSVPLKCRCLHNIIKLFAFWIPVNRFFGKLFTLTNSVDYLMPYFTRAKTKTIFNYECFLVHVRVRCTISRSHSTPCKKAEIEHLQFFSGHCLDFFLPLSGKICHPPFKTVKKQPTLIISFSQHSPFFEGQ